MAELSAPPAPENVSGFIRAHRAELIAFGILVVLLVATGVLVSSLTGTAAVAPSPETPIAPNEAVSAPEGSLGIAFEELRTEWNQLDKGPQISRDLRRTPESGGFHSFSHRFDRTALVAGAYDPEDDFVYALMTRSGVGSEHINTMYLHLCFVLHPYSPACIDDYHTIGLDGLTTADLGDASLSTSWIHEGNRWSVVVEDGVETIRVHGPEVR